MPGIIRLLPEPLVNQIAAGEVVQRPASVVKELLENALDAGATHVQLVLQEAGKTLIQVIDDGTGMSPGDARLCFERHATSKITTAEDLYRIRTLGFRGEALASIASVAQVALQTRQVGDELGTLVEIAGGMFVTQEPVAAPLGTSLAVRNLFYNVPARRKFLKSNPVETRHILNEFYRVALPHPQVRFALIHNGELVYDVAPGTAQERVLQLHSFLVGDDLMPLEEVTPALSIRGYLGVPLSARKTRGEQYFFVNGRYVRDNYLHHAVVKAYDELIASDHYPVYVLHLDLPPEQVDVNIHPTKTEVKFEDERTVYSLLRSAVRQALGRLHRAPEVPGNGALERDELGALHQMIYAAPASHTHTRAPAAEQVTLAELRRTQAPVSSRERMEASAWQRLYDRPEVAPPETLPGVDRSEDAIEGIADHPLMALPPGLLLQARPEGLLLIDQHRAHERVLYEQLLANFEQAQKRRFVPVQQLLYPLRLSYAADDFLILEAALPDLRQQGFDLRVINLHTLLVSGVPNELRHGDIEAVLDELLAALKESGGEADEGITGHHLRHSLARAIARKAAIGADKRLAPDEQQALVAQLMACQHPSVTPGGQRIFAMVSRAELLSRL
jgi:DNA mismatch repair protein MutL